jgi:hypothetical protein
MALDWLKRLKKYGRSDKSNRIASTAVENGEIALALSNNFYWLSLAREKGAETLKTALSTASRAVTSRRRQRRLRAGPGRAARRPHRRDLAARRAGDRDGWPAATPTSSQAASSSA